MQPETIEIAERQVTVRPGHELDRDVLFWIDETLPHTFRYLGLPLHDKIEEWLRAYAKGLWYTDINHVEDGAVRFADPADATLFNKTFEDRLW